MMYTRERLIKAVREAGRDGRQFTLGEVRAELGIKSRDKREQKRFRSRFRECSQVLGDNLERLGPNTFRLTANYLAAHPLTASNMPAPAPAPAMRREPTVQTRLPVREAKAGSASQPQAARGRPDGKKHKKHDKPEAAARAQSARDDDAPASLMDRVGVGAAANDDEWKRRPREQVSFVKATGAEAGGTQARQLSFGERVSSWFGRPVRPDQQARVQNNSAASVALSRLAVELQPKAAGFEYRWIDGKLEVQRANK